MGNELISKIIKAALDVGGKLSADKTNQEQRYDYLSADKILSVCGQALFGQGVAVLPRIEAQETVLYEYTDAYGKSKRRYDSRVDFVFTITDGGESQEQKWYGMGSDYTVPDKALYKAVTSGHKYFLMKLLCVGAGNEDGEHESDDGKDAKQTTRHPVPALPQTTPAPATPVPQPTLPPSNGNGPSLAETRKEHWSQDAKMSFESATAVTSSAKGNPRYVDIDNETLGHMATSLTKTLKQVSDDQRESVQYKLDVAVACMNSTPIVGW